MPPLTALEEFAAHADRRPVLVRPIPLPDPARIDSAHADRMLREAQREAARIANAQRHADALSAATQQGREQGYKAGYVHGWKWGLKCGALAGFFAGIGATLFVQWLHDLSALVR